MALNNLNEREALASVLYVLAPLSAGAQERVVRLLQALADNSTLADVAHAFRLEPPEDNDGD